MTGKNSFEIGGRVVKFTYTVKDIIDLDNQIIVLLEIPYSDDEINNIYAYDKAGNKMWRVNTRFDDYGINKKLPFEIIRIIDGKLYATDFYGRRFQINLGNGQTISYDVVK